MNIRILDGSHAQEVYSIILDYQNNFQNRAQFNWQFSSIKSVLKTDRAFGLFGSEEFSSSPNLTAFIIYKDLQGIAEILSLGTSIKWQRRGQMTQLLARVKKEYQEIWLEVHEDNEKAIHFYNKEDFILQRVRPKYYTDSKAAKVMSWKRCIAF
jgi:ribosomal protein S18 acetylase RimI-like enzyme